MPSYVDVPCDGPSRTGYVGAYNNRSFWAVYFERKRMLLTIYMLHVYAIAHDQRRKRERKEREGGAQRRTIPQPQEGAQRRTITQPQEGAQRRTITQPQEGAQRRTITQPQEDIGVRIRDYHAVRRTSRGVNKPFSSYSPFSSPPARPIFHFDRLEAYMCATSFCRDKEYDNVICALAEAVMQVEGRCSQRIHFISTSLTLYSY